MCIRDRLQTLGSRGGSRRSRTRQRRPLGARRLAGPSGTLRTVPTRPWSATLHAIPGVERGPQGEQSRRVSIGEKRSEGGQRFAHRRPSTLTISQTAPGSLPSPTSTANNERTGRTENVALSHRARSCPAAQSASMSKRPVRPPCCNHSRSGLLVGRKGWRSDNPSERGKHVGME